MGRTRVFLSGAIADVPDLGSGWRPQATEYLTAAGFEPVSTIVNPNEQVFFEPNEVVHRDMMLQKSCDLLLVEYMIPNRSYLGTDFELCSARQWSQPAIVFAHEEYKTRIYLRYLATIILPSLEQALDYIVAYY